MLASYANQVIGYTLANIALKISSISGVAQRQTPNVHSGFSPIFA
jgi:hypothetical protein